MTSPDDISLWDAEAATFDEPADHGLRDAAVRDAWRSLLLELLPPAPARVADLGCGTGTLSLLLAEEGYTVDGLDFSPEMLSRARVKTAGVEAVTITEGDAFDPPFPAGAYDVVLSRHVLWALPDPAVGLARWARMLRPGGRLVLVEGRWSTDVGLTAAQTVGLVRDTGFEPALARLDDPSYWGRAIDDERYVVVGRQTNRLPKHRAVGESR